ncbi:hypothetical protein [Microcella sp.]|uniref:hypothetical protein n=1 Tax=Microcella sp. TaxID=1913979 RepID=UPI00255DD16C|nr:hypothetical protein [Microcella sp.]MBX9471698.1 hypothetical protein [Microcella sp.]
MADTNDTDLSNIDGMLRDSFARISEPGASDGVADAIRSRVAAGDTGTAVATATAPGWSAGPGLLGTLGILGASALVVGAGIGGSAALFAPGDTSASAAITLDSGTVSAGYCPGAAGAAEFLAGEHVLIIARSDDSSHVAVRSSADWATTVWLPTAVVVVEPDQADLASLPVAGCAQATGEAVVPEPTEAPAPTIEPGPAPQPGPPAPPPPPSDTTAPSILQSWVSDNDLYQDETATFTILASDNVAVTSVSASWSGARSGSATLTKVGNEWRLVYARPIPLAPNGTVTFTFRAKDAAGNQSAPAVIAITLNSLD